MTTVEDEIRHLVAQLREAFTEGDDEEMERVIAALETKIDDLKMETPPTA